MSHTKRGEEEAKRFREGRTLSEWARKGGGEGAHKNLISRKRRKKERGGEGPFYCVMGGKWVLKESRGRKKKRKKKALFTGRAGREKKGEGSKYPTSEEKKKGV